MIIAATGHRPDKLGGYGDIARLTLEAFAEVTLQDISPGTVISGLALGWDQAVAEACVRLRIPFIAAVPFPTQANRWPEESQHRWQRLIGAAERVHIVTPENPISQSQAFKAMEARNHWMVNQADQMLALWNGDLTGGTANCIRYAERREKQINHVWNLWAELADDPLAAVLG